MRPGTNTSVSDIPIVRSAPTDSGVWFVTGVTQKGAANVAIPVRSMSEYGASLGIRVTYGWLYDALETFFRVGGSVAYVGRVVGPTPVFATHTFQDAAGTPVDSIIVTAKDYGDWGNGLSVAILAGLVSGFRIQVSDVTGILETSGDLATQADAVAWASVSNYIRVAITTSTANPAPHAAVALTGGTDDHANAVDAQWQNALNLFTRDLGPGQVSAPGRTTATARQQLTAHAAANDRSAVLDLVDTWSTSTLLSAVSGSRDSNARWGYNAAPWVRVPGVVPNTVRPVPPSAVVAGRAAAVDRESGPNTPAAGKRGVLPFVVGLTQPPWSDGDGGQIEQLNAGGVNVIRYQYGNFRIFGWRSTANPVSEPNWLDFANVRLVMEIQAKANEIGDDMLFDPIDGAGATLGTFQGRLTAMLLPYYTSGALYGASSDEAFTVNVADPVNTLETEQDGQLNAEIGLRASPFAEMINITINKQPITQGV